MSELKTITGSCYCGACKFKVTAEKPTKSLYCHCSDCRKAHSSPIYYVIYVPKDNFELISGDIAEFGKNPDRLVRKFCIKCGSRVYNHVLRGFIGFFPALCDDNTLARDEVWKATKHIYCDDAIVDFTQFDDGLLKLNNRETEIERTK